MCMYASNIRFFTLNYECGYNRHCVLAAKGVSCLIFIQCQCLYSLSNIPHFCVFASMFKAFALSTINLDSAFTIVVSFLCLASTVESQKPI